MANQSQIVIPESRTLTLTPSYFYHTQDGKVAGDYQTDITINQLDDGLKFTFHCHNNIFTADNSYLENNSEMWNQEVFEIFIASGSSVPTKYLEIELNPNNAIYTDVITNNDLTGKNNSHLFLDAKANGIRHSVTNDVNKNTYYGEIYLPFTLIGKSENYRINFFRVISKHKPTNNNWACSPSTCLFLAFNPTRSGLKPQFHLPEEMSLLTLQTNA